jgi:microsomal dipeptidase-like Zn-dependent dipeptidase
MNDGSEQDATVRVPLGGDYWKADPGVPLWGMADLHAHLMAHLAFGGHAFWGLPYDPDHPQAGGMPTALASCEPIHGGLINLNPEFGHPAGGGWPDFDIWPRFTTLVHQQCYIDWLYRAYQGGLRLVTCLAVNNELLASKSQPITNFDDRSAIQTQVSGMKAMVEFVDREAGGPGKGWLKIAYSPEDAAQIISANKLAVILGVEVDSLGNWRRLEDLQHLSQGSLQQAHELISHELDWLYNLGIRQITPVHLTDNAFGGTAIYMRFLEVSNRFVTGRGYDVENGWETGVRYRLDHDGADVVDDTERTIAGSGKSVSVGRRAMNRRTLVDHVPGIRDLATAAEAPHGVGSHSNQRTLSPYGKILLEEMMERGMLIDIDHMSQKTLDTALDLAEANDYPVLSSHAWFRDLAFSADVEFDSDHAHPYGTEDVQKVAHEAGKRRDQIERISKLGGIVSPIWNQGDMAGLLRAMPELAHKVPHPSAGSSTSWAQAFLYVSKLMGGRGVAMGSDINGAATLPGPRFGTLAAFGARNDAFRVQQRRAEIDSQTNGVLYDNPLRDYRWYHFLESGAGGYDQQEREIWQAIATYMAGFNPWTQEHPKEDQPGEGLRRAMEADQWPWVREHVDDFTRGFWAADDQDNVSPAVLVDWPREIQASFMARTGRSLPGTGVDEVLVGMIAKVKAIWAKWDELEGENPPLLRCTAGPHREYDINLDGVAHYGLLPDFLQDMRNSGLSPQDLAPLFRSAYDYVQMWQTCQQRSKAVQQANLALAEHANPQSQAAAQIPS